MTKRTDHETKGKGGRPRGKPLSAKERAQRRAAAVKAGEHATTALGQALPPCKPAVCPNEGTGTCDVKRAVEARGGGLSACLVSLGHHEVMQAYLAAIQTGDLAGLAELAAASMAGQLALAHGELSALMQEGAITPRSSGERERDQGLGLAGRAAWVSQMRKGLAGQGEDSDA